MVDRMFLSPCHLLLSGASGCSYCFILGPRLTAISAPQSKQALVPASSLHRTCYSAVSLDDPVNCLPPLSYRSGPISRCSYFGAPSLYQLWWKPGRYLGSRPEAAIAPTASRRSGTFGVPLSSYMLYASYDETSLIPALPATRSVSFHTASCMLTSASSML
jgi:hypothetical protein